MIQHRSPLPLERMEEGTVKKSTVFGHWTSGLIGFCFAFQVGSVRFLQDRARSLYTTEKMGKVYAVAGSLSQRFFIAPKETAVQGDGRNGNNGKHSKKSSCHHGQRQRSAGCKTCD